MENCFKKELKAVAQNNSLEIFEKIRFKWYSGVLAIKGTGYVNALGGGSLNCADPAVSDATEIALGPTYARRYSPHTKVDGFVDTITERYAVTTINNYDGSSMGMIALNIDQLEYEDGLDILYLDGCTEVIGNVEKLPASITMLNLSLSQVTGNLENAKFHITSGLNLESTDVHGNIRKISENNPSCTSFTLTGTRVIGSIEDIVSVGVTSIRPSSDMTGDVATLKTNLQSLGRNSGTLTVYPNGKITNNGTVITTAVTVSF